MSQYDFGTINPATKSGSELATDLNSWRDAVHSSHAGSSQPSYAVEGMLWANTTGTNPVFTGLKGTTDYPLFELYGATTSPRWFLDADKDSYLTTSADDTLQLTLGGTNVITGDTGGINVNGDLTVNGRENYSERITSSFPTSGTSETVTIPARYLGVRLIIRYYQPSVNDGNVFIRFRNSSTGQLSASVYLVTKNEAKGSTNTVSESTGTGFTVTSAQSASSSVCISDVLIYGFNNSSQPKTYTGTSFNIDSAGDRISAVWSGYSTNATLHDQLDIISSENITGLAYSVYGVNI